MRQCVRRGLRGHEAAKIVVPGLRLMMLDASLVLQRKTSRHGLSMPLAKIIELYRSRKERGLEVSHNSAPVFARFIHLLGGAEAGLHDAMDPDALFSGLRELIAAQSRRKTPRAAAADALEVSQSEADQDAACDHTEEAQPEGAQLACVDKIKSGPKMTSA